MQNSPTTTRCGVTVAVIDLGDFACQPSARYGHEPYGVRCLSGRRVIDRMIGRVSRCRSVDQIHVVGSNVPPHIEVSPAFGSLVGETPSTATATTNLRSMTVVQRIGHALDQAEASWAVYLPAIQPMVDPALIDHLLDQTDTADCDFIGYADSADEGQTIGLGGEVVHADAIRRLRRGNCPDAIADESSLVGWMNRAAGAFHLRLVPLPPGLEACSTRFAIRNDRDWDDMETLCRNVDEEDCSWQSLVQRIG